MTEPKRPTVASLVWKLPSQLHSVQADAVQKLGYPHQFLLYDAAIPQDVRIILIQGPYGSLLPLVRQIAESPLRHRPVLAYWFQQSLSLPGPDWFCKYLSITFSELYRYYNCDRWNHRLVESLTPNFVDSKGKRLGFLGDILWLYEHRLLDVLALSSTVYRDYLQQHHIDSIVVPRGFHPSYGSLLNRKRDIAAVWMGKLRTRRRAKAIYWLRNELEKRGLKMNIYDGQENEFIFGNTRTEILNRTWFVLNVFFSGPTDELSIRYYIAGANGAVVLSEPGANKYPFEPGTHILERKLEEMPDTIMDHIEHREKWQAISDNILKLRDKITLEDSVAKILSRAELLCRKRLSDSL